LETEEYKQIILETDAKAKFQLLGISIMVQSWIAGLFLGKITTGNYTGGFMYSAFLVLISIIAIILIELKLFNVAAAFG
jgi:hypothetical protein